VGNNGSEPSSVAARASRQVACWRPRVEAALAGLDKVALEDERLSLAVHFRGAADKRRARAAVRRVARRLDDDQREVDALLLRLVLSGEGARRDRR